jgi:altronate dehydratase
MTVSTRELADELIETVGKAAKYYATLGHGSFALGNAEGGLTTQEEKSMGAYSKSGSSKICGILKPGDAAPTGRLYLLDMVPDGPVRFGFPNINDNAEIAELIACGSHMILFSTGRGSVVGSAISPVNAWRMIWMSTQAASWKIQRPLRRWGVRSLNQLSRPPKAKKLPRKI